MKPIVKKRQFKVIIEKDEDGYFVASVPALPGCYTQAKTLLILNKRIKEATLLCLEVAETDPEYKKHLKDFGYEPSFIELKTVRVRSSALEFSNLRT